MPKDFLYNDNIIDQDEVQKTLDLVKLMSYYVLPAVPEEEIRTAVENSPYDCAQNVIGLLRMMCEHIGSEMVVPNSEFLDGDASEDRVIDITGMVGQEEDDEG